MPLYKPEPVWAGEDVFIIGGGVSLEIFNWQLLREVRTIGCNSAFLLGSEICNICVFGDDKWFKEYAKELQDYNGLVFTNHHAYQRTKLKWIWFMPRKSFGLGTTSLAWNKCTGAVAINLALILGAKRVILIGFDMKLRVVGHDKKGKEILKPNWHDKIIDKPKRGNYRKFNWGFKRLRQALPDVFPDREIINVTDDSDLNEFPKITLNEFWKGRKHEAKTVNSDSPSIADV